MLLLIAAAQALEPIPNALAVHISRGGLDRIGAGVAQLAPRELLIGATAGELACDESGDPLQYDLDGLAVGIHISDVEMVPSAGRLDLYLRGTLDSSEGRLTVTGDCAVLQDLTEVCSVELPVTSLEAHVGLSLALVDSGAGMVADATVDAVEVDLSPIGNPLGGCLLSSAVGTLLGQSPEAISGLLLGLIEPALADLGGSLEAPIEDALSALTLSTPLSLGGANLLLDLAPAALTLDDGGLTLALSAALTSDTVSECVPPADPPATDAALPPMEGLAPDGALAYDAAILVNRQLVDALLYTVWQSGMLCLEVQDAGSISLNTDLFAPVFGDAWSALLPPGQPVTLQVYPEAPPTIRFADNDAPFRLQTGGLSLLAYAELDSRPARIFGVGLDGEIGLDVPYSGGVLAPALVIDPVWLRFAELDHELLPYGYSDGLAGFVPTVLSAVLPADLLPSFAIPTYRGLGLGGLWWQPSADGQWIGGYALIDIDHVEPLELPGCEGASIGCDGGSIDYDLESALGCAEGGDSGCGAQGCGADGGCADSGCATRAGRGSALPWLLVGGLLWWRRRG